MKQKEIKSVFDGMFWLDEAEILYWLLLPLITKLAIEVGKDAAIGIGVSWGLINDAVVGWASKFAAEEVTAITVATQKMVQNKVTEWIGSGKPLRDLEQQLIPEFGEIRAKRIAVTEVTNAYAGGNLEAFKNSGVVDEKEWRSAGGDACPICLSLDGQRVQLNAMFISGYDGSAYDRPPAHVNCILPGNEVMPVGNISAAAKSFYEGGCIEISLANGSKFTVTKNHPILTDRDWIPAHLINEGVDSVFTVDVKRIAPFINPNNQQIPAMIEDIFTTLEESIFCSTIRVPATSKDFNGDGRNIHGDVDIISANRFLGDDFDIFADKKFSQICLDRDSFGFSHLPSLSLLDLHKAGNLYTESSSMGGFDLVRPLDSRHSAPLDFFGLGLGSRGNISLDEPLSEGRPINTHLARQFIFRFSSNITVEKVVKIRNFDFSGHVYDLQCDDYGLYLTNGIITHNCRCWIQPVVREP